MICTAILLQSYFLQLDRDNNHFEIEVSTDILTL
jgi:hypothetical protein